MLDAALDGGYAYAAVNVTSSQTLNGALRGFAAAGADFILADDLIWNDPRGAATALADATAAIGQAGGPQGRRTPPGTGGPGTGVTPG